jgi:DNA-directed RNA polymerase II subunit RPB1
MGIVQDALLGIMLFTTKDTFLELDQVMNLLMWIDPSKMPTPCIIKPKPLWSGK